MKVAILGSEDRMKSWQQICGENNHFSQVQNSSSASNFEVFIDLNFDSHPERIADYAGNTNTIFLLSAVLCTPELAFFNAGIAYKGENIFGINAIPGFLERTLLEISNPFGLSENVSAKALQAIPHQSFEWVKSRVGMVTPRIIFMIINEAFYTMQEGTATAPDIDQAMKLGTAYPHGPFEWMKLCGIENVYQTLASIYDDTREERYKICAALKTQYLQSRIQ
jgi:3-hydroxybutyryl-CoA dehydrogenase